MSKSPQPLTYWIGTALGVALAIFLVLILMILGWKIVDWMISL